MNPLPLPEPYRKAVYATSANSSSVRNGYEMGGYEKEPPLFDKNQMISYAAAVREAALEEAASAAEQAERFLTHYEVAAAIRALKNA